MEDVEKGVGRPGEGPTDPVTGPEDPRERDTVLPPSRSGPRDLPVASTVLPVLPGDPCTSVCGGGR